MEECCRKTAEEEAKAWDILLSVLLTPDKMRYDRKTGKLYKLKETNKKWLGEKE